MSEAPSAALEAPIGAGTVDWGDTSFQPEVRGYSDDGPIRFFRMSHQWPQNPVQGRKFQLGGKERVALLEETVFWCWAHRYSITYMGSGVNGTRRCTQDHLGHCLACQHFETAPTVVEDGKNVKKARCGKRQQQFGANLIVYKSDLEGRLLDPHNQVISLDQERGPILADGSFAEAVFETFLWRFSADKFQSIREIKQEWGTLKKNDMTFILAPGKPENFQDFTPTVSPTSVLQLINKARPDQAREMVDYYKTNRYEVENILGKKYTDDDVRRFLFGDGTTTPGGSNGGSSLPVGDVAAEIERELANIGAVAGAPGGGSPVPLPAVVPLEAPQVTTPVSSPPAADAVMASVADTPLPAEAPPVPPPVVVATEGTGATNFDDLLS